MAQKTGRPGFPEATIKKIQSLYLIGLAKRDIASSMGISEYSVWKYTRNLQRDVKPPINNDEQWVRIDGYGGRYWISSHGRVFSNGNGSGRASILSQSSDDKGYRQVILSYKGKTEPLSIHQAVANAFCSGKTAERNHVNHIDGNPSNNHASNLEWCTRSENMLHSVYVLGNRTPKGFISRSRKLTPEQVRAIRSDTRPESIIAKEYGVGHSTISNVRRRAYYKDVV